MLFAGSFQNYAYDPKTNLLAISVRGNPDDVLSGTYFIDQSGMRKVDEAGLVYYLGWRDYPFILAAGSTKLLSTSGESKTLAEIELVPFASRNNKYVALCDSEWSQTTNGLRVFDNDGNLVFEIKDQKITKIVWRIDSRGLFYVANNQLYYVEIQDKLSVLIDSHLNDEEFETMYMTFNWVR